MRDIETMLHANADALTPDLNAKLSKAEEQRIYQKTMQKIQPEAKRDSIAVTTALHSDEIPEDAEELTLQTEKPASLRSILLKSALGIAAAVALLVGIPYLALQKPDTDSDPGAALVTTANGTAQTTAVAAQTTAAITSQTTPNVNPAELDAPMNACNCIIGNTLYYLLETKENVGSPFFACDLTTGESNKLVLQESIGKVIWFVCLPDQRILVFDQEENLRCNLKEIDVTTGAVNNRMPDFQLSNSVISSRLTPGSAVIYKNVLYYKNVYNGSYGLFRIDMNAETWKAEMLPVQPSPTSFIVADDAIFMSQEKTINANTGERDIYISKYSLDGKLQNETFYSRHIDSIENHNSLYNLQYSDHKLAFGFQDEGEPVSVCIISTKDGSVVYDTWTDPKYGDEIYENIGGTFWLNGNDLLLFYRGEKYSLMKLNLETKVMTKIYELPAWSYDFGYPAQCISLVGEYLYVAQGSDASDNAWQTIHQIRYATGEDRVLVDPHLASDPPEAGEKYPDLLRIR